MTTCENRSLIIKENQQRCQKILEDEIKIKEESTFNGSIAPTKTFLQGFKQPRSAQRSHKGNKEC
ncbi:hypothetical protein Cabys_3256 [Caldithrix abyssi DSM 13497]|uniref:Uncharacterized protein n=1 Tax=Caldithrix abyssi DSM 13497 TaxID=880073 RepID=A0A1J1CC74_CALAY|nr:hypothetical protein Cabys_3256 [Caldithrix abyssi DSM 13497]